MPAVVSSSFYYFLVVNILFHRAWLFCIFCWFLLIGMGLMRGLVCTLPVGQVAGKALENGLIVITAGSDVLRFVPPLVITKDDVDEMILRLEKTFSDCH